MDPTHPRARFGGTWVQITDKFLYCANNSKQEGGSKKITVQNLPAHNHTFTGQKQEASIGGVACYDEASEMKGGFAKVFEHVADISSGSNTSLAWYKVKYNHTPTGTISNTGSGTDYMPPYITVYAWYRTA